MHREGSPVRRSAGRAAVRRLAATLPPQDSRETGILLPRASLPLKLCMFVREGAAFTRGAPHVNLQDCVLIAALSGTADVTLDALTTTLSPGHALLILPRQYHQYGRPRGRLRWLFLAFQIEATEWLRPLAHMTPRLTPPLWEHLAACLRGYADPHRALPYVGAGMALELWRLLAGLLQAGASAPPALLPRGAQITADYKMLLQAKEFITAHLGEPIGVPDVARHVGLSPTGLQQLFSRQEGRGVGAAIRAARIYRAALLMNQSNAMIKQIAALCGFNSIHAFSRAFKRLAGRTPIAHRRLLRQLHGEPTAGLGTRPGAAPRSRRRYPDP